MSSGKRLVDDGQGQLGHLVRRAEESAFVQARTDGREVVAADVAHERDLLRDVGPGLSLQPVERRVGDVRKRNAIDRACVDDAGNRAHGLQLGVDECHAPVEVLVAEERSLERQEPFAPESDIRVPQVLKALEEKAAACQQHDRERRFDDNQRMLEPVAARARRAASTIAECFLRSDV